MATVASSALPPTASTSRPTWLAAQCGEATAPFTVPSPNSGLIHAASSGSGLLQGGSDQALDLVEMAIHRAPRLASIASAKRGQDLPVADERDLYGLVGTE